VATLYLFQLTDITCLNANVIFLSNNPDEEPKRRKFIKKLGQASAKPVTVCWLEQKSLKITFLKIL
jgi:ribonucleotide monophosphatase NagD (HAD superfamily)